MLISSCGFFGCFWSALRGAATLKQRVQRETRSNASVIPYEKGVEKGQSWSTDIWCKEGELLKRTRKGKKYFKIWRHKKLQSMVEKTKGLSFILDTGDLHKTRLSIYINKKSQVRIFFFRSKCWSD
jgi:hypothetical protein